MTIQWQYPPLGSVIGKCGMITDGDWVISENMDPKGEIRLIQLSDIGAGQFLDRSSKFVNKTKFVELNCTALRENDILISRMADPIGRACLVPKLDYTAITAVDVTILRVDPDIADPKYIVHVCNSSDFLAKAKSAATGTTRSRITRRNLEKMLIPLPVPSEQRRIVEILEQADSLRQKRAEADAYAARILSAMFYRMFGDSFGNPMGWKQTPLGKMLPKRSGALQSGPFGSQLHNHDFVPDGTVLAVGVDNVHDTGFEWGRGRRITEQKYAELKKFTLEPGDVLITIMGTIGRTCVFPPWAAPAICTKHVYRIQLDPERLHAEYLSASIRFSSSVRSQLGTSVTGQIVAGITSKDLRALRIDEPPIELQRKFATVKAGLDEDRERRMRNRDEINRLFNLLLHRAFSGDLTAKWREAHMKELLIEMEAQVRALGDIT